MPALALAESAILTALLTHGFIAAIILCALAPREGLFAATEDGGPATAAEARLRRARRAGLVRPSTAAHQRAACVDASRVANSARACGRDRDTKK